MKSSRSVLLPLFLAISASEGVFGEEYITNESEDAFEPQRVTIPPFQLEFYPTSGDMDMDAIHDYANDVLKAFIPSKVDGDELKTDYVTLINVVDEHSFDLRRSLQDETTLMEFDGGVASFSGEGVAPSVEEVNAWTKEATEGPLLETLQVESEYQNLETITFTSLTAAPTPSPTEGDPSFGGVVSQEQNATDTPTIAWSVVGAVVAAVVAVLLIVMMRKRRTSPNVETRDGKDNASKDPSTPATVVVPGGASTDDGEYEEEDEQTFATNRGATAVVASNVNDSVSIAGSEWTLSSNATDAFTVKSGGKVFPRSSHSLLQTESFERDRQVSLKKDMMQTPWSTATLPVNSARANGGRDTVLKPNHFIATTPTDSYEMDSAWNPDDAEMTSSSAANTESPFLFEAQGEEVVLMPPSQTRTSRRDLV